MKFLIYDYQNVSTLEGGNILIFEEIKIIGKVLLCIMRADERNLKSFFFFLLVLEKAETSEGELTALHVFSLSE